MNTGGVVDAARSALIIASSDYQDPGLRRLRAPGSDAQALEDVLRDPEIGGFDVRVLLNEPAHEINLAVEEFFADRRTDDLLLVHFSCHGIKDEDGELYFAATNTRLGRLGATAVAAEFVNRRMSRSRSRRIVLLLDCCYAGAFERGMTARSGAAVGIEQQFGGRGRAVITASSAMEYAFEGGELSDSGEQAPSVFTSALVQGLRTGDADRDQDGRVGLDELYDYIFDKVRTATPQQTPGKWSYGVQGGLYIARRARPVTTPTPLPPELLQAIDSPLAGVRAGVVPELERLVRGRHAGLSLAAALVLERFTDDDSRMVAAAATAALVTRAEDSAAASPEPVPATPRPAQATEPTPTERAPSAPVASALPPAAVADTAVRRTLGGGWLLAPGALAIAGGLLTFLALFPYFVESSSGLLDSQGHKLKDQGYNISSSVVIEAVVACAAGICVFVPRTRSPIGLGLVLGATATAPTILIYDIVLWWVRKDNFAFGPGMWLHFVGGVLLMLAACSAAISVARTAQIRFSFRGLGPVPWLVAVLGVIGAAALGADALGYHDVDDFFDIDNRPLIWTVVMALAIPTAAAAVSPRRFGVALLTGWIGCGVGVTVFVAGSGISFFGAALLALAAVITPFALTPPPGR